MLIFHLATAADWERAVEEGHYATSTRGRTLEQEGFLHASHAHQWRAVRARWYADVAEPLVLLTIDTDLLAVPVVEEPADGELFPHIYGRLDVAAVVVVEPLPATGPGTATSGDAS